ncbi:MAG: hypothetical protein K0Q55_2335 [Verrucomicrobia bacterium]|jgi:hypothetical protein|nr:hypothetical protein [Verrucomicrobiota bacterium]
MSLAVSVFLGAFSANLSAASRVDYTTQIKPILVERCYACHGVLKQQSKLRVDTAEFLKRGGKHGAGYVPGKPESSHLVERISAKEEDERMPPEGELLKPEQIALIKLWIAQGAKAPADEKPEVDPKDHWAFKAPVRPTVPKVKAREWAQNPIDAFIAAEHQERGLKPQELAEKSLWLRRVYLDLTGLPPGLKEIHEFEADNSAQAYEKVVDRLLASPQYGERWGRHFMDIWRYSDWYGLGEQLRYSQKHLWHWRDWIVESLNKDKGYNRMVVEMLAGDEIAPTDRDTLRATGFLARNYYLFNRTTWMDEVVEHTSKAFLGMTMNCAKCHDHKFDPLTAKDYYAWRAFFEPYHVRLDELPGEPNLEKNGLPRSYDVHLDTPTYLHVRGDEKNPDKSKGIAPTVPVIFKLREPSIKPVSLPAEAHNPALQEYVFQNHLELAKQQLKNAQSAKDKAQQNLAALEKKAVNVVRESVSPVLMFKDDFTQSKTDVWEQIGGQWKYEKGSLKQTEVGSERRVLRSRTNHPTDFHAKLRYKISGGEKWKSVGLSFDIADERDTLVYLSAYTGSKLQIALTDKGKSDYPPAGIQNREVKTGVVYELELFVLGKQLTVFVDGEQALTYELPQRREGRIQLTTFDASAEFLAFELSELPKGFVMKGASDSEQMADARAEVENAEKLVSMAELRMKAMQSVQQADRAKSLPSPPANLTNLVKAAARDDAAWRLAEAESALAKLQSADRKAKKGDAKKLKDAREAVTKAKETAQNPGDKYTSLRGSLKALEGPDEKEDHRNLPFPATSTGRRTALAQWIANVQNPLTARVAVNHLWLRHFGQPLVPTVMDFGRRGAAPTHPELLDWLATEFMESGWSMKHMHRLMVLSRTYRLNSSNADAAKASLMKDAENKYYWRMNPVRMEAQSVRDSLLQLAGQLDLRLGGPTIDPNKEDTVFRRSLYFTHSKDDVHKFLDTFDNANVQECYRRSESVLPQQALALANSKLSMIAAGKLAEKLTKDRPAATDDAFIHLAYETIMAVEPSKAELEVCVETLMQLRSLAEKQGHKDPVARARAGLVHALFNHNDFITVR